MNIKMFFFQKSMQAIFLQYFYGLLPQQKVLKKNHNKDVKSKINFKNFKVLHIHNQNKLKLVLIVDK